MRRRSVGNSPTHRVVKLLVNVVLPQSMSAVTVTS